MVHFENSVSAVTLKLKGWNCTHKHLVNSSGIWIPCKSLPVSNPIPAHTDTLNPCTPCQITAHTNTPSLLQIEIDERLEAGELDSGRSERINLEKKIRRSIEKSVMDEMKRLRDRNRVLERQAGAAAGSSSLVNKAAEELRRKRANESRCKLSRQEKRHKQEVQESRLLRVALAASHAQVEDLQVKVSLDADAVQLAYVPLDRFEASERTHAKRIRTLQSKLDAAHAAFNELKSSLPEPEPDPSLGSESESESSDSSSVEGGVDARQSHLDIMKSEIGVKPRNQSVPHRQSPANASPAQLRYWKVESRRHIFKVLEGRGDTWDGVNNIASALDRLKLTNKLVKTGYFSGACKMIAQGVVNTQEEHWSARLSVHIWDRLGLSRDNMETLRHLLSYTYDPIQDCYNEIRAWQNPSDKDDFVKTCKLVARRPRERLFHQIADACEIKVGDNGRCERNAIKLINQMYSNYENALRSDYTLHRPAQPVWYIDGTGQSLGLGITHSEIGSADFIGHCKQSRDTMSPLSLYAGDDHGQSQRENLGIVAPTLNKFIRNGTIARIDGSQIPARLLSAADMQGTKSTYGMCEHSHSVWCKCQRGNSHQKFYRHTDDLLISTYEEMEAFIINEVGCEMKSEDDLCAYAHYSIGVHHGGAFTSFTCPCCGYSPHESEWRASIKAYQSMTDEEQQEARRAHNELDAGHLQHYHQVLYQPPMLHLGMEQAGVDQLHLIYLNLFKHLFKYTVHEGLPGICTPSLTYGACSLYCFCLFTDSKKRFVKKYLKEAGFYSYDPESIDEDPVKRWIGREVKRFLTQAHLHLPFLLQVAAAPADLVVELVGELAGTLCDPFCLTCIHNVPATN